MSIKIPYGLNSKLELVHIDSVKNGIACDCICPECKRPLSAKNGGEQKIHHFAHLSNRDCTNAGETILHLMAKKSLVNNMEIILPEYRINQILVQAETRYLYKEVILEKKINDYIPDASLVGVDGSTLLVEIYVSHKVDDEKRLKIFNTKNNCLEIDLSDLERHLFDEDIINQVQERIFEDTTKKEWIFSNAKQAFLESKFDNKMLVNSVFFDKETHERIEYNERLSWKSGLNWLWKNNNRKPFIAGTWYKGNFLTYYINEDPELQIKIHQNVYGYKCKEEGWDYIGIGYELHGRFQYYECKVMNSNKVRLFNPTEKVWIYVQDNPDDIINEETIKIREEGTRNRKEQKEQELRNKNREVYKKRADLYNKESNMIIDMDGKKHYLRSIYEVSSIYGKDSMVKLMNYESKEIQDFQYYKNLYKNSPEVYGRYIWICLDD